MMYYDFSKLWLVISRDVSAWVTRKETRIFLHLAKHALSFISTENQRNAWEAFVQSYNNFLLNLLCNVSYVELPLIKSLTDKCFILDYYVGHHHQTNKKCRKESLLMNFDDRIYFSRCSWLIHAYLYLFIVYIDENSNHSEL